MVSPISASDARRQTVGIKLEEKVGAVTTEGNQIEAVTAVTDSRKLR